MIAEPSSGGIGNKLNAASSRWKFQGQSTLKSGRSSPPSTELVRDGQIAQQESDAGQDDVDEGPRERHVERLLSRLRSRDVFTGTGLA